MGLISFFRNLYYDNKLKKADRLLNEGRSSEAEQAYLSIVDKHPMAACKLAEYYLSLSSTENVNNDISLFKKTIELKSKSANIYDAPTFEPLLSGYIEHIQSRARSCFENEQFEDCFSLTSALKETDTHSDNDAILCSEARIRLLYKDFNSTKVTDSAYNSLIESFKREWSVCKSSKRAKDSALAFCQKMIDNKRYYASNLILCIILNDSFDSKCLDNATQIIKGHDSEASPDILNSVALHYTKSIVLREGISTNESVIIFNECWKATYNHNVVMEVLKATKDKGIKNALVEDIIKLHKSYLTKLDLLNDFSKWIYDIYYGEEALNLLERIHALGYDVEYYYTQKNHSLISKLSLGDKLPYLDHAQKLFPNASIVIEDKLACAQEFLNSNENEKAIAVANTIINRCEKASLIKAMALLAIAESTSDIDERLNVLHQAHEALHSYHEDEATSIDNSIVKAIIKTAEQYYKESQIEKAYTILRDLANNKYVDAAITIASFRLSEIHLVKVKSERLISASSAIDEIKGFDFPSIVDNADYQALWDEKISSQIVITKEVDNQSAVSQLEGLIHEIDNAGFNTSVTKEKKAKVVKQLIERKYLIARDLEKGNYLSEALELYKEIYVLEEKKTPTLSAIRFILCKLKEQNNSDILGHKERIYTILRKAAAAYKSEKKDIAYRFALILLKSGEDKEALSVLNEFLPEEEHLKKACEQGDIIKALAKLEDFNSKVEAVSNKTLSSDDAVFFINHMLEYADVIRPVLDLPRSTLGKYRNKIKNYAIYKLFDEERFDVAFEKMIKEHKDYLDDFTALRNIALVCLNMAEANQINTNNYKEVISIWLTAIYQEQLFVKSLDYTSWDDQYTFSLYDAFGHFSDETLGDLPDNVNNDYSDDNNVVQIKEVQRALLDRFEAAVSQDQNVHEFYTSQKDKMDAFIALNLDIKCRIVAPYLARKDENVFQGINDALEQDRKQEYDNWEDVLSVGAFYQMQQPIYTEYSMAKASYNECIEAINSCAVNNVGQVFNSSKIDRIKKFKKISSALISYCNSKATALKADNITEFKRYFTFYLNVCSAIKDSTLSFVFSNFVMQFVVSGVNDHSMKKSEASDYILSIFILDRSNNRVRENLTTLFEMMVRDNTMDSYRAVNKILERIKSFDVSFYNRLNSEYEQAKIDKELNDIVAKVNDGSMANSAAIEKVYKLYSSNPNNSRICENLAQLCTMCIMEYIVGQKYGSSSIERILNSLNANKSPEFRKCSSVFRKAYNSIWNQLPLNTQMLLKGDAISAVLGQSLNEKGRALQKGLNYMKSLGGFSTTSSSIFDSII